MLNKSAKPIHSCYNQHMFGLFSKKTKIAGHIGYFDLQDWWESTFTQQERNHIEEIYHPMGSESNTKPLTEGELSWTSQTASSLLWALAGWFNNTRDREIAKRIIAKAEQMAQVGGNILDSHFSLSEKIVIYYRERETTHDGLEKAIQACKDQIAIAPKVAKAFLKEYPLQPLPAHGGYRQLRIILEKQGNFDQAIELCEIAKQEGWADDWDKQIITLNKKSRNLPKMAKLQTTLS